MLIWFLTVDNYHNINLECSSLECLVNPNHADNIFGATSKKKGTLCTHRNYPLALRAFARSRAAKNKHHNRFHRGSHESLCHWSNYIRYVKHRQVCKPPESAVTTQSQPRPQGPGDEVGLDTIFLLGSATAGWVVPRAAIQNCEGFFYPKGRGTFSSNKKCGGLTDLRRLLYIDQ